MCNLINLTAIDECVTSDGGIYETQIVDGANIASVVFDALGQITAFVMTIIGAWVTYTYDDNNTASYDQTGARENKKVTYSQVATFQYAGLSAIKIQFAQEIVVCCKLVAIHRTNSGVAMVQGIELLNGAWAFTKEKLKATPNVLTETGAGEDKVVMNLNSVGRGPSPVTTLSSAAISAL